MKFSGFARGTRSTPVPNPLLGPLLQAMEDPAELKCTLRALWFLHQKKGYTRFVVSGELLSDRTLLAGLRHLDPPPPDAIRQGMKRAVERGIFISRSVELDGEEQEVYLLNDEAGRRAAAMIDRGEIRLRGVALREGAGGEPPERKANIFTLYEENIGMLTPLLAEEMKEAEQNYPWSWVEEAFKIAVGHNKRSWRYIDATLRRWATEGKDDGKSGRYSQKAASTQDLVEYLRKRGRLPKARGR